MKAASDADAVRLMTSFLADPNCSRRLRQGALQALGVLCLNREDARQQLVEAKVLPAIVAGLSDAEPGVRSAVSGLQWRHLFGVEAYICIGAPFMS